MVSVAQNKDTFSFFANNDEERCIFTAHVLPVAGATKAWTVCDERGMTVSGFRRHWGFARRGAHWEMLNPNGTIAYTILPTMNAVFFLRRVCLIIPVLALIVYVLTKTSFTITDEEDHEVGFYRQTRLGSKYVLFLTDEAWGQNWIAWSSWLATFAISLRKA